MARFFEEYDLANYPSGSPFTITENNAPTVVIADSGDGLGAIAKITAASASPYIEFKLALADPLDLNDGIIEVYISLRAMEDLFSVFQSGFVAPYIHDTGADLPFLQQTAMSSIDVSSRKIPENKQRWGNSRPAPLQTAIGSGTNWFCTSTKTPQDFYWMKFTFDKSGNFSEAWGYKNNSHKLNIGEVRGLSWGNASCAGSVITRKIGSVDFGSGLNSGTMTNTIDEIGFIIGFDGVNDGDWEYQIEVSKIYVSQGEGIIGFDNSIKISDYYLRSSVNAGGAGIFSVANPFLNVSIANLAGELKKTISFSNLTGLLQFKGEVSTLAVNFHEASYEVEELMHKTKFTPVNESPIIKKFFIQYFDTANKKIIDRSGSFSTDGGTTDHVVAFEKSDTKAFASRPIAASTLITENDGTTTHSDFTKFGDFDLLYFFEEGLLDSANAVSISTDSITPDPNFMIHLYHDTYRKFGNAIDKIHVFIDMALSAAVFWLSSGPKEPRIKIWNNVTSSFDTLFVIGESDFGTANIVTASTDASSPANTRSPQIEFNFDLEEQIVANESPDDWLTGTTYSIGDLVLYIGRLYISKTNGNQGNTPEHDGTDWNLAVLDYANETTTAGASNEFNIDEIIIVIQAADVISGRYSDVHIFQELLTVTYVDDNNPELSSAGITAIDDTEITTTTNGTVDLPAEDGFGVGDVCYIVKTAEAYLQSAWDNSQLPNAIGPLVINVAAADTTAILEDFTVRAMYELMQEISTLFNSTFFPNYDTPVSAEITSAGNLTDSGITITSADVLDFYRGGWSHDIDATVERTSLKILGDGVVFNQAISTEHTLSLGDETEFITDNAIKTIAQASTKAAALIPIHDSAAKTLTLTIDYSNPVQDYSTLRVGRTVLVKLPTVANPSIVNDTFMVLNDEVNVNEDTAFNEHHTLFLQKRET